MKTSTVIEFGPYSQYKPVKPPKTPRYRYPYLDIKQTGQDYGFFVGRKKRPEIPKTIKNRVWAVLPAEREGQKGYYIYVKNFTNGFNPFAENNYD